MLQEISDFSIVKKNERTKELIESISVRSQQIDSVY